MPRGKREPSNAGPEALERQAYENLKHGRHRDAIANFKQLLELEARDAWRQALADAYAGRARELSAKGMFKEAQMIWENRAGLGADIACAPDQAWLMLRMGLVAPVCDLVTRGDSLPAAEIERLRAGLAARLLSGDSLIAERLPADDPVRRHAQAAGAALAAYCAGDDAGVRAALAVLPFRSPYRDWVQIIKALQCLPDSPEESARLLARIGEDSAFGQVKQAAELALLPEGAFLHALRGAARPRMRFACALRGWSERRIALWEELDRSSADLTPKTLLRILYKHRQALGTDWVRRRSLSLLAHDFPASTKWLAAVGAEKLSTEETLRLAAWYAEHSPSSWVVEQRWREYAQALMEQRVAETDEATQRLRIALVMRRGEQISNALRDASADDLNDQDRLSAALLEESLTWDPDDLETYLRLIHYYRRSKSLKDGRRLLEQASARWPRDRRVLSAALDTALDAGSFKKAAGLAREILTVDPINSEIRERLVESHLAHARKQILNGRSDLAAKTLDEAREWARSTQSREQLDLATGLLTLTEDAAAGATALRGVAERLGGGLAARVALALAGDALRISPQKLFKTLGLPKTSSQGRDDLLAALARLRHHLERGGKRSRELDTHLSKLLQDAAWAQLSRGELESACETLRRCALHKVRLSAAKVALKQWRGAPLFELHAFEAKYPQDPGRCSQKDLFALEMALERARADGDTRTLLRIKDLLMEVNPFGFGRSPFGPSPFGSSPFGPPPFGFPVDDFDDDDLTDEDFMAGSQSANAIVEMIKVVGLMRALDMLGMPPQLKREVKRMVREVGEEVVAEKFMLLFEQIGEGKSPEDIFPHIADLFR